MRCRASSRAALSSSCCSWHYLTPILLGGKKLELVQQPSRSMIQFITRYTWEFRCGLWLLLLAFHIAGVGAD